MGRPLVLICAFSLLLTAPQPAKAKDAEWEFIKNDEGVDVYRKEVPGSDMVAFKGITTANLPIGKILAVFRDPNRRKFWVDRYVEHKTFIQTENSELYWIHFHLPWPISDRDYVLKAEARPNAEKKIFTVNIKSVEFPKKPEDDCCVRATVHGTFYEFTAIPGSDKTKMIVEVHTDPKGALPSWLVNLIQKSWPAKTLNGLIDHAKEADLPPVEEYADWHSMTPTAPAGTATATTAP